MSFSKHLSISLRYAALPLHGTVFRSTGSRLAIVATVAFLPAAELSAAPPAPEEGFHWVLVFEDEFHGDTLDSSKWSRGYPWGQTHNHKAYMAPRNVQVEDGKLVITAEAENHPSSPDSVDHDGHHIVDYTSGAIHSQGNFQTTYGYIEARLKLSAAQGAWPAFWTLQSGWPPEIDIMENLNGTDTFYTNYHWGTWQDHHSFFRTHHGNNLAGAFRTYGFDWTSGHMSWYFQNNRIAHFTNTSAIAESANHYLLLNLAVGGWPGDPDPADYPVTYEADWVRVWKQVPAPSRRVVGHWRLNERFPGPVADATGNSDGSLVNNPVLGRPGTNGVHNYAFDFSGGLRGVNTHTSTVVPETADFTLSVSFRTIGTHDAQGHLFSNNDAQAGRCNLHVVDGVLHWWHAGGLRLVSPTRVDDGQWHRAKVMRQGDEWSLWLNDERVDVATADVAIGQNRAWFIGRAHQHSFPFEGWISEVNVLNHALNLNRLMEHWRLNDTDLAFTDGLAEIENAASQGVQAHVHNANSPGNNPTTGHPGATFDTGTALRLNTKFQRIETSMTQAEHFGDRSFTLAFWFRNEGKQDGTDVLASSDNGSANTPNGWTVELTGNEGADSLGLRFFHRGWGDTSNGEADTMQVENAVTPGLWHHVVLVRSPDDEDNLTLYLDGSPLWTRTNHHTFGVDPAKGVWFGRRPNFGVSGTIGLFDDIRFYSEALSAEEIASLSSPPDWEPLPADGGAFIDPEDVRLQWRVDASADSVETFRIFFGPESDSMEEVAAVHAGDPFEWDAGDLEYGHTYYWRLQAQIEGGDLAGPIWSFSTKPFQIPGTVIQHSPKATGRYVGSPSIIELPNGHYLASHDWFGPGTALNRTILFESADRGHSWREIATLKGQFWSNLFLHREALYLMGTSGRYEAAVIRRSDDGGHTWTTPQDENTGILFPDSGYHTAPMPVVLHDRRIWRAMEDNQGGTGWGNWFRSFVVSAPENADLLKASSWTDTNRLGHDPGYLDGQFGGWLEGNMVVDTDGNLVNVLRVDYRNVPEKAAIIRIGEGGETVTFDPDNDFITFPGGAKKFVIRHDPESGKYWTLSNAVLPQYEGGNVERTRNAVTLKSSVDLREWTIHDLVLHHPDVANHGFQYLDWQFDGDDLIAASRTAYDDGMGGANNAHDANFMTFHRVENFRGPHAPFPEKHPRTQRVDKGLDAVFTASVTSGAPEWRWYRVVEDAADEELSSAGRFTIVTDCASSTLRIDAVQSADAGDYYAVAENETGAFTFPTARLEILAHALIHHWRLDEDGAWSSGRVALIDSANPEHEAAVVAPANDQSNVRFGEPGAENWTGSSIYFGGTSDRAELGDVAPREKPFTIAFWFKMNQFRGSDGNQDHILSSNSGQFGRWNVHLLAEAGHLAEFGGPQLVFWQDGPGRHELLPVVESDRWYHVALVRGPEADNNFRIYLDGGLVHQGDNHLDFTNSSRGVFLAARPGSNISSSFDGWIDDVRFYDGVLQHLGELWGDGYARWARDHFGAAYGTPGTRLGDDHNRDGVSNFSNYAFGTDPHTSGAPPSIKLERTSGSAIPALEFTARADRMVAYFLQSSENLTTWASHPFSFDGAAWSFAESYPGELTESLRDGDLSTLRIEFSPGSPLPIRKFFQIQAQPPK